MNQTRVDFNIVLIVDTRASYTSQAQLNLPSNGQPFSNRASADNIFESHFHHLLSVSEASSLAEHGTEAVCEGLLFLYRMMSL